MNILSLPSEQEKRMTSKEMAELTEKRHDSVKRTIVTLSQKGLISYPQFVDGTPGANGVAERVYHVTKRDSYVVVAQLSPEFTARLVDRWQELESQGAAPGFAIPQTFAEALRLAADQQETIQQQAAQLAIAAPKLEFVAKYVESTPGSKGFRQVAKILKANEAEFRAFLQDEKIMYRLGGDWVPYQQHSDAGRFEVKTGTANEHAYSQAKFTAKGVEWVAGEWAKFQVRGAA
jgi:phage antirepressor YoqD-like protein